jgi:hypothetical protein
MLQTTQAFGPRLNADTAKGIVIIFNFTHCVIGVGSSRLPRIESSYFLTKVTRALQQ